MPRYQCPSCGKSPLVPDDATGQNVRCPYCCKPFFAQSAEPPWFLSKSDQVLGPFTRQHLQQMAAHRQLRPDDAICQGEGGDWVPANMIHGLFPAPPPPAPTNSPEPPPHIETRSDRPSKRPQIIVLAIAATCSAAIIVGLCVTIAVLLSRRSNAPIAENSSGATSTESIVANAERSVALIEGRVSSGTGFIIRPGIVVTNKHVIRSEFPEQLKVHFPSAEQSGPFEAKLLYKDPNRDLAFLSVSTTLPALTLASDYQFRRGEDVIVIGNPGAGTDVQLENAVSRGVMSSKATIKGQDYYQLGISINAGNSGGPVLDSSDDVIGVVTLKAEDKEGLGFCVPLEHVVEAAEQMAGQTKRDVEVTQSHHRLLAVCNRIRLVAIYYAASMEIYTESIRQAIADGHSIDDGIVNARTLLATKVGPINSELTDGLDRWVSEVSSDGNLDSGIRQRFVDLWTNCRELQSYVENPRGNYLTYSAKCRELQDNHTRYSEALMLLLGPE